MSDFVYQKGYIYPLPEMDVEEEDAFYESLKDPFTMETLESGGKCASYLLLLTEHSYGQKNDDFGFVRDLTPDAADSVAPKFKEVLGADIDTSRLKYIEHCYYDGCEGYDWYRDYMESTKQPDDVPITDKWLDGLPQFEKCGTGWWYTTKDTKDSPSPHDVELAWRKFGYCVIVATDGCESQMPVKTVGTLVQFLRLCGLGDFAEKIQLAGGTETKS